MAMFIPNWVDLVVLGVLGFGIWSGRRKGMSEELLDMLQWIAIAFITPRLYETPGRYLAAWIKVSPGPCLVLSYIIFAILIRVGFGFIRKATGQKLLGKDTFGRWEYPLGIAGAMIRMGCMILVAMAIMNARYVSKEEVEEMEQAQRETLNGVTLPTLSTIQRDVFISSHAGLWVRYYFSRELISPAPPVQYEVKKIEGLGKKMERAAEEALDDKKK